ncbi:MAG: inositol monophosphatase family protein [Pleomorphochaeta sp.]
MNQFKEKFNILCAVVRSCGIESRNIQSDIKRSYKSDGTVLTKADLYVSSTITEAIKTLFPKANIVNEELEVPFYQNAELTFILDPIDGTDAYSQGLPSWAISLGLLDKDREPIGAIIYAPRFGQGENDLFIKSIKNDKTTINDREVKLENITPPVKMIAMEASSLKILDFSQYKGNIRIFGSAILHMLSPIIFPYFQASVHNSCYVWDVAGPHAVLKNLGLDIEYIDGTPFIYNDDLLINHKKYLMPIVSGNDSCRKELKTILSFKN